MNKVWENESTFQIVQHFSGAKSPNFLRKTSHFWKNYFKISNFQLFSNRATNPEQFSRNAHIGLRDLSKPQQNWLRSRRNYWKLDAISWKSQQTWIVFCGWIQDNQDLMNNVHQARKRNKQAFKTLFVSTKMKNSLKAFKQILCFW